VSDVTDQRLLNSVLLLLGITAFVEICVVFEHFIYIFIIFLLDRSNIVTGIILERCFCKKCLLLHQS